MGRVSGALRRWPVAIGLIGLGLFVFVFAAGSPWSGRPFQIGGYRLDLDVYRIGSLVWQRGGDLYGVLPRTLHNQDLPFTYPPLSAIAFTPLSRVPFWIASAGISVLTALAVLVVLVLALRRLGGPRPRWVRWLVVGALFPVAIWFEPVRETLNFGQINAVLMALVAIDCLLVRRSWPRGILVGIAAALKLTPAAFILWFLVRRDWRGAIRGLVSFGVVTGLAFVLDPRDSVRYWTSTLFDTGRIGAAAASDNQSITGTLARFGLTGAGREVLWLALAAGVLVLATLGMRRALAAGQPVLALSVNALAVLLCSPISWSHHWVWAVPLVVSLGVLGVRSRSVPVLTAFAVSLVVFLVPSLSVWDVYLGVALLAMVAFVPLRRSIGWGPPLAHADYLSMRRLAGLDGLRAIAALLVVLFHNQGPDILQGWIGVQIFFVLSGFLITTLLLREHAETGRVNLGSFYLRRAFRILPVYLLVLGLITIGLLAVGKFAGNPLGQQFPLYLLFGNEFTLGGPFGQSWTLGIEQKFYLVWPVLAFTTIVIGRTAQASRRAALTVGLLTLALAAVPFTVGSDPKGWPVNYVSILLGCVVAQVMHDPRGYRVLRPLTRPGVAALVGVGFVLVHLSLRAIRDVVGHQVPGVPDYVTLVPVYALAVAILLPAVVAPGPVSWLLSRRPMTFLGDRSYAIYLVQNLAQGLVLVLVPTLTGLGRAIPVALVAVLFAQVIHCWVERPMIERGRRIIANRRARSTHDSLPAYSERVNVERAK